jgi:carboxypeptidase Q
VVLFGSEEVGLVGAQNYAEVHKKELNKHIAAAESDFGADVIWRLRSANVAEDKLNIVKAIIEILEPLKVVPVYSTPGNNQAHGGPDLKYMREAGVPIIEPLQNGKDYFDLHHTADDTFDKIDPIKLRQNVAVYAAFVYLLADMDETLR